MVSDIHKSPSARESKWEISIRSIYDPNGKKMVVHYWTQQASPVVFQIQSKR